MKLAVYFPGIGYHIDKPLLYYSRKLLKECGYEELYIEYHDMPAKIRGNKEMMQKAVDVAYEQSKLALKDLRWDEYEEVVFVGKSIGTVVAARLAEEMNNKVRLILYTPVEATFSGKMGDAVSFIGDNDPWSIPEDVIRLAKRRGVPISVYSGCNHSLEGKSAVDNLDILKDVMQKTKAFVESGDR